MALTKREALSLILRKSAKVAPKKFDTWADYQAYKNRLEE
jgi:hypothetical protein